MRVEIKYESRNQSSDRSDFASDRLYDDFWIILGLFKVSGARVWGQSE